MGYYKKPVTPKNMYKRLGCELLKEVKDSIIKNHSASMLCGEYYSFIMNCELPKRNTIKKELVVFLRNYFDDYKYYTRRC